MTGPIALHGGGEFLPGDEPFLLALLEAARPAARSRAASCGRGPEDEPIRVVVIPAASSAAGAGPAVRLGVRALESVAATAGLRVRAEPALVVDPASAEDPVIAATIAAADLVHLPGGDPGRVPATLDGTAAWRSVLAAHARGAVVAGASAGAMAMAGETWTPDGWRAGLGLVRGLIVIPHFEAFDPRGREAEVDRLDGANVGRLGLDERTGVLRQGDGRWRVVGAGRAHWFPPRGAPVTGSHGVLLPIGT